MLKKEVISRAYRIRITKKKALLLHEKDKISVDNDRETLGDRLDSIDGVFRVEYSNLYGTYIFLSINSSYDNEKTWTKIEKEIINYMEKEK